MNALVNHTSRFISILVLSSILLQQLPIPQTMAQAMQTTSTVDILHLTEQNGGVKVAFAPLAEGITITARVDAGGRGDFLTISSALATIKNGVIAIAAGQYQESDLVVPANVILQGGYDPINWQRNGNDITIIQSTPNNTALVLQQASALQNIVIRNAKVGVRIAVGPATLSKVAITDSKKAIELSPHAELRVQNSDLIANESTFAGTSSSKLFVFNSLFQNNAVIATAPLHNDSFIKNSSFFPNKDTLLNIRDEGNSIERSVPLPKAEWSFPQNSNTTAQNFDFSAVVDTEAKTIPGPTINISTGINAIELFYDLPEGDELRIVDRSNISTVVFHSKGQSRQFRDWVTIPTSTQLSLLLDLNGDGNIPLQAGISNYALLDEPDYATSLDRGMTADSSEAKLFYRGQENAFDRELTTTEEQKLNAIFSPVILAGDEWLKGESFKGQTLQQIANFKGFTPKVLLNDLGTINPAANNFAQLGRTSTDTRFFSRLLDYLQLETPPKLNEDLCTIETNCPFESNNLAKALDFTTFSLRQQTSAISNERGVFNSDGWNAPSNTNARLQINLPEKNSGLFINWIMQPFVSTPDSKSHLLSFLHTTTQDKNSISLFMEPNGSLTVSLFDDTERLYTHTTGNLTWVPGRKYSFSFSLIKNQLVLQRNDGIDIWRTEANVLNPTQILIGKRNSQEPSLPLIVSDFVVWFGDKEEALFGGVQATTVTASLPNEQSSLSGSVSFEVSNLCQQNSLKLSEGASEFITISGSAQGNNCALSLQVVGGSTSTATIPTNQLNQRLALYWNWNSVSNLGVVALANKNAVLISTLPGYNSAALTQPFALRNISLTGLAGLRNVIVRFQLLNKPTDYTLQTLVNIERYEILYSENEQAVYDGTANKVAVTIDELNANITPEKFIPNLTRNNRYFFAVQAILETGGATPSSQIRNIQLSGTNSTTQLEAAVQTEANLPTSLAALTNHQVQTVFADTLAAPTETTSGKVLQSQLGEPLTLTNGAKGTNTFTAWSLGKDLTISTNSKPQHIYSIPGQYIISELRTLADNTILKQFVFAAVGAASSDKIKVSAETWTANSTNPEAAWISKQAGRKIPAIIGVSEPIYLLGKAVDVVGSADNAYTWSYSVNWGDGATDTSEAVKAAFNQTRLVNATKEQTPLVHRYENPGIYTIVTEVNDEQGNTGFFENTVVVTKPEPYPQQITSLPGISRLVTVSGGTAPYTVQFLDGSTRTLPADQNTFTLPITESGTVTITDRFNNETELPVTLTSSPRENQAEVYLPANRSLIATPATTEIGEIIDIRTQGEDHLFNDTIATIFHFGDVLPSRLGDQLPALDSILTYNSSSTTTTYPFLTMGIFPAVLTVIDEQGNENKKSFFVEVEQARLGTQSNAGIITGSVPAALHTVPGSIEIWQRNTQSVQLAELTPNENGRFVYFVPNDQPKEGLLSIRVKDKQGTVTRYTQNIGYSNENRPEQLYGILETNGASPLFGEKRIATNAKKPTFFGLNKNSSATMLQIASNNPTQYELKPDQNGAWLVESSQELEEGKHVFTILDKDTTKLSEFNFTVDRTAPKAPKITHASWSQIAGKTEPYAYIGVVAKSQTANTQYIQADSKGQFHINFNALNQSYVLAAADEAGNVSPLVQIDENTWQEHQSNIWWQRLKPYVLWTVILLLTASGLTYARKIKI